MAAAMLVGEAERKARRWRSGENSVASAMNASATNI